jgi:hypothetical protein
MGLLLVGSALLVKWMVFWRKEGMIHATIKIQDRLVTYGMYGYVRHPHYLSVAMVCFGFSLLSLCFFNLPFSWFILPFSLHSSPVLPLFPCNQRREKTRGTVWGGIPRIQEKSSDVYTKTAKKGLKRELASYKNLEEE